MLRSFPRAHDRLRQRQHDMPSNAPGQSDFGSILGKRRLLVIDDDRKLCRLIKEYLDPMGYAVEAAHSGPEGLEKARGGEWHAVLLDVMLPGMDGFEVLKELRRTSTVPVLMLTARGEEADRIVGLELGADARQAPRRDE